MHQETVAAATCLLAIGRSFPEEIMADTHPYRLQDGARVAVIGGGPAGAFFAHFLLGMAAEAGRQVHVDIFEPRDFTQIGAQGCNGCAGIVSESLVQLLAQEGIDLPPSVVQREIDSYVIHMDAGSATIRPPRPGQSIGAVHRGAGPRDLRQAAWIGLDAHVQGLATARGARVIPQRVSDVGWGDGRPLVSTRESDAQPYDLLAVTAGVNSPALKLFSQIVPSYQPPQTSKTFIREYFLGAATVDQTLGNAIQVFLLDIPRLEFGMLIPKGEYVTVCLLGEEIDNDLLHAFLAAPEVLRCLPPGMALEKPSCQCAPRINVLGATQPYGDRVVFIGDSASTRLYKDGIGSAFRTAKAAAVTAIGHGVAAEDFRRHYLPACQAIEQDNQVGRLIFAVVSQLRNRPWARSAVMQTILDEQGRPGRLRRMSAIQWDMYTGSGSYWEILLRSLHPTLLIDLVRGVWAALRVARRRQPDAPVAPVAQPSILP
jgi:flavin-dependent dehydrogenase